MNLNLDFSAVTRFLRGTLNEFRDKKLWPLAVVLLAGIVAVPVLLTSSSSTPTQTQTPAPVPPPASGSTLPALDVQSTPAHSTLNGPARDPFGAASGSSTTASSTTTPNLGSVASVANLAHNAVNALTGSSTASGGSSVGSSSTSSGSSTSSTGSSSSSSSSGSGTSTSSSSNPPSITGNAKPKPAPSGLKSTQSYDVALSITNSSSGVDSTDPLERLSVLPSQGQPLLVELGLLKGGNKVLFAVLPGAEVAGPGTCTPGPVDCEILSLGQDQTEAIWSRTNASHSALFAVTGVTTIDYSSAAAVTRARQQESTAGRALLSSAHLSALSLFQYEPSVGSVVNLSNLTVGG
jgi:hypothetical protein